MRETGEYTASEAAVEHAEGVHRVHPGERITRGRVDAEDLREGCTEHCGRRRTYLERACEAFERRW